MNGTPQPPASDANSALSTQHSALVEGAQVSTDPGSSYLITVQMEEQYEGFLDADALHRLAMEVLKAEGVPGPVEVGVVVTTDAEVRALNKQYLGHDYETDVLSFGMMEDDEFVTPTERPSYLGDVVVSYDRAADQAPEYGHTPSMEVATLVVHGLLHLLGYNDAEDTERERMHARQQELLQMSNLEFRISN
ncbi:MAG TPA: rRNA maturation RNase YbeY [Chloroflexia bacterium]|nr:rRNA maturation RNase YbeY [Chloroflexia bacterium]